jgi:hypothetical protein
MTEEEEKFEDPELEEKQTTQWPIENGRLGYRFFLFLLSFYYIL